MGVDSRTINDYIADHTDGRIIGFDGIQECTEIATTRRVEEWHEDGSFVVANAGAYDVLGLNHIRGLIQARIIGAAYRIGSTDDMASVYDMAVSDEIRLVVSLDTNEAIRDNKSCKDIGGGSIRPLLDWDTRAMMLALQSIRSSHDLVDFITKHGPSACSVCEADQCWHSDQSYSVGSCGADLTIVKSPVRQEVERRFATTYHAIDENDGAFTDRVLDSQISTSALVRRIKRGESSRL